MGSWQSHSEYRFGLNRLLHLKRKPHALTHNRNSLLQSLLPLFKAALQYRESASSMSLAKALLVFLVAIVRDSILADVQAVRVRALILFEIRVRGSYDFTKVHQHMRHAFPSQAGHPRFLRSCIREI